jgi:hypothetical protein
MQFSEWKAFNQVIVLRVVQAMYKFRQRFMNIVKQVRAGIVSQLRNLWKVLVFLYLPIVFLFLLVGLLSRTVDNVSLAFLLRDVTATGKLPFFAGFVSQLEAVLWSAALTVCLFALVVMHMRTINFVGARRFLLYGSILTLILLLDDVFLFHEEVVKGYLHMKERYVFAGYMVAALGFVILNWREILASEYALLLLAFVLFATSIFFDVLPFDDLDLPYLWEQLELFFEDGSKFAGIATWLLYFARYAIQRMEGTRPTIKSGPL